MSALGSDISRLPHLHRHGAWLPIEAPLLSMQVVTKVLVNGRPALGILDTGAMGTTMSFPVATKLGLVNEGTPQGERIRAVDAHGDVIYGEKLALGELRVGSHVWDNVTVTVVGDSPDLFLVGADVLQDVELYIAADEGLVGLFAPGAAPRSFGDLVVPLKREPRQLFVEGTATAKDGRKSGSFELLVDTGAWNTSVPAAIGINSGLPADLSYSATTVGVAGEQEARGRFVMDPLYLGPARQPVGRVLAVTSTIGKGEGFGLLGNDVFMRFHTVISFARKEMRFRPLERRPASRMTGPSDAPCLDEQGVKRPCVSVGLRPVTRQGPLPDEDLAGACLQIDVDQSYAGKTVELLITAEQEGRVTLFNGGAIRAFLSVADDGVSHCFALWRQLERLGVTPATPLSLRFVRTEGVQWPCDPMKTRCITFTGPLATLDAK
jgi:predicted aspartyl protease